MSSILIPLVFKCELAHFVNAFVCMRAWLAALLPLLFGIFSDILFCFRFLPVWLLKLYVNICAFRHMDMKSKKATTALKSKQPLSYFRYFIFLLWRHNKKIYNMLSHSHERVDSHSQVTDLGWTFSLCFDLDPLTKDTPGVGLGASYGGGQFVKPSPIDQSCII